MEEKFELTEQNRKILINYFLGKPKKIELDDIYDTNKKEYQQGEKCVNPEKYSWWYDEEKEIFNQQAHVIMRILSNKNLRVPNKGFRLWYALAFTEDKNTLKKIIDNKDSLVNYGDTLKITDILKKYSEFQNQNIDIDHLLDYVELYFNKESNFSSNNDYSSLNKPILNNLYNWYLKDITDPDEINTCCKQFEQIISNMQQLLIKYFDNTVYKYNLICTLCKTNEILNELKLKILNKNKNDNENDSQIKFLETENDLIKTILKNIELTPTIKFNNNHKK